MQESLNETADYKLISFDSALGLGDAGVVKGPGPAEAGLPCAANAGGPTALAAGPPAGCESQPA